MSTDNHLGRIAVRILDDLLTLMGMSSGRWPLFWGGFGSCVSEFAILGVLWQKVNCHARGCWRVGLHKVDGTPYITCRKHHPVHPGSRPATAEQIAQAHAAAHLGAGRAGDQAAA